MIQLDAHVFSVFFKNNLILVTKKTYKILQATWISALILLEFETCHPL